MALLAPSVRLQSFAPLDPIPSKIRTFDSLEGVHETFATGENVSAYGTHEAQNPTRTLPFLRASGLPQDGKPQMRTRSNDNSRRSSGGSGGMQRSSASPNARSAGGEDSPMSDVASTAISRGTRSHSVAYSDAPPSTGGRRYHLEVVQHPERTAETTAVLSRLPLSPPIVVKLTVEDPDGNTVPAHTEMPFLAAHLWLYDAQGENPVDLIEGSPNGTDERMLYGTLVSSLHHLKDTMNQLGMFFIFPDVSVRQRGTYTLQVSLLRLTNLASGTMVMPEGQGNSELASVKTDQFIVVPQQEFNAPAATALTSCFHRQGARMYTPFQTR